jgi:hypothetical protein
MKRLFHIFCRNRHSEPDLSNIFKCRIWSRIKLKTFSLVLGNFLKMAYRYVLCVINFCCKIKKKNCHWSKLQRRLYTRLLHIII